MVVKNGLRSLHVISSEWCWLVADSFRWFQMVLGGFVWFAILVAVHDVHFSEMCTVVSVFESHVVYGPKYMGL